MRQRDDAGHDLVGHANRHLDLAALGHEPHDSFVVKAQPLSVRGIDPQRLLAPAAHQDRRVVHPRVVGSKLAQADQQQREVRVAAVHRADTRHLRPQLSMVQPHPPALVAHPPRQHAGRDEGRDDDAMRMLPQPFQAQPAAAQPEAVTVAAHAQQQVDDLVRLQPDAKLRQAAQRRMRVRLHADFLRDRVDDPPLLTGLAARRDDRLGVLNERRRVEAHERQRDVVSLKPGRARQDVVGVTVGLVDVDVERHIQVERVDRGFQCLPVRAAQDRVAGAGEERPDLAVAGRCHLLGEQRRGQCAEHVGEVADPRARLAVGGEAGLLGNLVERDRRRAEDRPAGAVEVACRQVQQIEQERDERPEAAQARARAPVDRRAVSRCETARDVAHDRRLDTRTVLRRLRREAERRLAPRRPAL